MEFFKRGKKIEGGENFIREKLNTPAYIWSLVSIFISFLVVFMLIKNLWGAYIGGSNAMDELLKVNGMTRDKALYSMIFIMGLNLLNIFGYVLLIRLKKAGYYLIMVVSLLLLFTEAYYFDGFQLSDLKAITGFLITTALLMLSGENNSWKKLS